MADGPGNMGDAPPQSPSVIDIAVRLRLAFDRELEPPEPATPLSAVEPASL